MGPAQQTPAPVSICDAAENPADPVLNRIVSVFCNFVYL